MEVRGGENVEGLNDFTIRAQREIIEKQNARTGELEELVSLQAEQIRLLNQLKDGLEQKLAAQEELIAKFNELLESIEKES